MMLLPYCFAIILLAPLLAGLVIGLAGNGARLGRVGVAVGSVAFALSLVLFVEVTTGYPLTLTFWSNGNALQFAFYIDRLSAVMLIHIAAISILIHSFSIRYMHQERGYARFHSLLAFTTFSLFGMVSSRNLLMLFAFWQLLSWLLPLLSYNYQHRPPCAVLFGHSSCSVRATPHFLPPSYSLTAGTARWICSSFSCARPPTRTSCLFGRGGIEIHAATAVTLLIFIGAMAKSAQFPLHMWLPDSLYAPTPVHALLHAGIINAGGFLLTRLAPLYDRSPATLHLVFAVGNAHGVTRLVMMLVQSDIKKTLGYSTIGQMGFMIMECGVGAYGLAIFHLIAHGFFKGSIFLNCGYVIHAARKEPRFPPRAWSLRAVNFPSLLGSPASSRR